MQNDSSIGWSKIRFVFTLIIIHIFQNTLRILWVLFKIIFIRMYHVRYSCKARLNFVKNTFGVATTTLSLNFDEKQLYSLLRIFIIMYRSHPWYLSSSLFLNSNVSFTIAISLLTNSRKRDYAILPGIPRKFFL